MARQSRSLARRPRIDNRVYGRGTADNKGQHSINLAALRAVREARGGKLGFNAKFLVEMGEEIGSPDLNKVCASLRDELKADLLLASDGPRLAADRPTIFLGCRGGIRIHLDVNLREGGHHSGNWGGVLANPATILANAIASLVDEHGRMKLDALKPPRLTNQIRSYLADVEIKPTADEPALSENWGEEGLSAAERLYAWNTLEVLAMSSGNIDKPANAIPGHARAVLQLRFVVGTKHRAGRRCRARASARPRLPDGGGQRDAKLYRLAHRFRQPLDHMGGGIRSGRPPERRPPCCRISAARCRTTCSRRRWACRRSGCRIPIPAARSTRPTSTSCLTSPRRRSASWRGCSGISERGRDELATVMASGHHFFATGGFSESMTQALNHDALIKTFSALPAWLEVSPALVSRGRFLDCDCRLGLIDQPFFVSIRAGRIVEMTVQPTLMRSWRFSYRASPAAWTEYWEPMPRPGWHDLLALTKRGEAVLEGDLHPFMAHLQYFKDLLALPRLYQSKVAA